MLCVAWAITLSHIIYSHCIITICTCSDNLQSQKLISVAGNPIQVSMFHMFLLKHNTFKAHGYRIRIYKKKTLASEGAKRKFLPSNLILLTTI